MDSHRLRRLWAPAIGVLLFLGLIVLVSAIVSSESEVVKNLNAIAGVFVALFALVAIWVEVGRDRREARSAEAERARVDARVGVLAFVLHRQLVEWGRELAGIGSEADVTENIRFWGEMGEGSAQESSLRTYRGMVQPLIDRWRESKAAQDIAEQRLHELQAAASHATLSVQDHVERALVHFYDFAARLNRQLRVSEGQPEWRDLVEGLHRLEETIDDVKAVVTPRLLQIAREEVALAPSLLDEFAGALEAAIRPASDPTTIHPHGGGNVPGNKHPSAGQRGVAGQGG